MKLVLKILGNIIKFSLFVYIAYLLISLLFIVFSPSTGKTIEKSGQYEKAYNMVKAKEKIKHFPKSIPEIAKNEKIYFYTSDYGGEIFLLEFQADKTFLERELQRNKFINLNSSKNEKIYHFYEGNGIKPDGYIFYVIDDEENRSVFEKMFPYYSGIGIKKDFSGILYYFFYPAD